jgi:pimeloyl-ACP methyl ester carboxylesterase
VNGRSLSGLIAVLAWALAAPALVGQEKPASPQLKDEMRMPWARSNERFIRQWLVLSDIPLAGAADGFEKDWLAEHGGETAIRPVADMTHHLADGSKVSWRQVTSWGDSTDLSDGVGLKRDLAGYAFAKVSRKESGKALLSIGSDESVRAWVNGALVLDRRTERQLTFDEDQVEVDMKAGENTLLVKVEQRAGPWIFSARVLERGTIVPRVQEIGPSLLDYSQAAIVLKTDINKDRAGQDKVRVQVVGAGGKAFAEKIVARGDTVRFDPAGWPDGAYEVRCATRATGGLLYSTHLPWYKGDAIREARELIAAAAKADQRTPEGFTTKMLADMVLDRLGKEGVKVAGNPWWAIHAPLMEFEEMKIEAQGKKAFERPYGFVRLAYRDEIDGSPQFCRVYLPGGYDRSKKWPLVVKLHGYNPANPDYVRWWAADSRHHSLADVEYSGRQGVIYMEPHGRGNTTYLGLGDQDIVRVIELAEERLSIDEDRVYLVGDSMGGWGTWNVATRHPGLFAAIAPVFGGADYHSQRSEEELAKLTPLDRFLADKQSSWSMGEALLNMPILVHHGDVDRSVNVEYSRYGVRMLQRWGFNVRYVELPGYGHEDLNEMGNVIEWFLEHRRVANPRQVRLRSTELQNPSAYWVRVEQAASPKEFMVVNAEVADPNVIRLDSQNVLALTLSPGAGLIDPSKDVKVVWNGEARVVRAQNGRIVLRAAGYTEAAPEKNAKVAGPIGDVLNTPFAIVTGTAAADPAMKEMCRRKAEALAAFWKSWQRQPARVFLDSELSDADAARYSLILIGGPDANLVARKLAAKLPIELAADHVKIGDRSFAASDARVQMIVPNPLNAERYVLLVAATSADGMYFWSADHLRNAEFDFTIADGHMPGAKERVAERELWVAGGWFDRGWRVQDALVFAGDAGVRSRSVLLHAPSPERAIDPKILDSYAGVYQVAPGIVVKVRRIENRLVAQMGEQRPVKLIPVAGAEFYVVEGPVQVTFEKDASGAVVSFKAWQDGRQLGGKKIE